MASTKNTNSYKRSSFKSSERGSKIGAVNLKVQTLNTKPDFANLINRGPASTKNNVTKKQLEDQIMGISKKTIADSLAKNFIPQKMNTTAGDGGHMSTKSGKFSGVTPVEYSNDAGLLMQAMTSQMQTPHNQAKNKERGQKNSQIKNSLSLGGVKHSTGNTNNLHKRKSSIQSNQVQPEHINNGGQHKMSDHNFLVKQSASQQEPTFLANQTNNNQKGSGTTGAVNNSNKNSAVKEKKRTAKSGVVKLKLVDSSDIQHQAPGEGSSLFQSFAIQSQPITATNQHKTQQMHFISKKGASSSQVKPSKSNERGHTGQKSVTNKYTKVLAGAEDFDCNHPQMNLIPSSATNKIKKSFNFDTAAALQEISSIEHKSQDASGASKSKKQELINQILLQKQQQLAGNFAGSFMSNPPVGLKYLSQGGVNAGASLSTTARQSQKQTKVQNMKTQQLMLLQQQYAQASNQAQNEANSQPNSINNLRQSLKQGGHVDVESGNSSRKIIGSQNPGQGQQKSLNQTAYVNTGKAGSQVAGVVAVKKFAQMKAAKSVSSSKPPAHAQYFNSAKVKNDGLQIPSMHPPQGQQLINTSSSDEVTNRTAITTGNGKTQIEIQGNQLLCLWNVNIGQGAQANYIDQKGAFNLPYQMFQNQMQQHQQQQQPTNQQLPYNFYPDQHQHLQQLQQQQFQQAQNLVLHQSSSKESISGQQQTQIIQKVQRNKAQGKSAEGNPNSRQIDIRVKKQEEVTSEAEIGIFNKHFKRQQQTKVPLNIRTKKQVSSEAITQAQSTRNTTNPVQIVSVVPHDYQQRDKGDLQTSSNLMKLLTNNGQTEPNQNSIKGENKNRLKKAQNSSSMEQRRDSSSRQPAVKSSKKAYHGMDLVTDNREMVEVAQMHIPKVNLSTTNKTTRENNHPLFDQRAQLNTQVKKNHQLGMASGSYYDQEQRIHHIVESVESEQKQNHKRMQSLVTDPQLITKLGLGQSGNIEAENQMQDLAKRHTTKNTGGNPSIFAKGDIKSGKQAIASKPSKEQSEKQQKAANAASQMNQLLANTHPPLTHTSGGFMNGLGQTNGQSAPKAKKPPVAFNEEDLEDESDNADWMRKMEAEWIKEQTKDINKLIAQESLAKESRFAITSKGPLSLQTNNLFNEKNSGSLKGRQQEDKLKTQDVSDLVRRVNKHELNEARAEPYEEEDDCVVEETDPEEQHYPKHEPAQLSSLYKNKASNLSQHTSSTIKQKSPKSHMPTDALLKNSFLRTQQAQQIRQQQNNQAVTNQVQQEAPEFPLTVRQALQLYKHRITDFEKTELLDFKKVYFLGLDAVKIKGQTSAKLHNNGYDDENGDYNVVLKDHIYYRFEVLDFLGRGSFGQALKCLDHKTGEIVAVKIIKNKERYQHQAGVELRILQHLQKQDPEDQNNIIQIKDHCIFRNHLVISFELFSINLYEFIKNNNFQGVSLSLIRRFAIQILQSLKFLRDEDVIHCDLKPENILLKSPDKSGIKIIDFGSSCFSNQRIYSYIQSRFYRAPEIIIGIPYTTAIDMWSFGCILIELYSGIPIFPGESEMEQLNLIMQVFGVPPLEVLQNAERKDKFFRQGTNEPLHMIEDADGSLRLPGSRPLAEIIGDENDTFFDFIVQCLDWNPEKRITPFHALQHPWILEGLPRRVLIHHQRMLGLDVPSESSQASLTTEPAEQPRPKFYPVQENYEPYSHEVNDSSSIMFQGDEQKGRRISGQFEQSNPFEMGKNEDSGDDINQEMLELHNRSTYQDPQGVQLPARIIDNGMLNQFNKVENVDEKPQKQEMSRTQPMPSHFLQGKKQTKKPTQNQKNQQAFDNLNYQSLENGQNMLHFGLDTIKYQHHAHGNKQEDIYLEVQDIVDVDQLLAGQDDLPSFNPKSKTTNLTSLLQQINQSNKKAGGKKYEIVTDDQMGANAVVSSASGTTKYKLPHNNVLNVNSGSFADTNDFGLGKHQSQDGGSNVSFLMKHRIRQAAAGEQIAPAKTGASSGTAREREHNEKNNNSGNKIAVSSDYAAAVVRRNQGTNSNRSSAKNQKSSQPHKMMIDNFLQPHDDIL